VLLNIAQTFLHRQCLLALHVARLAPMLGLFHQPRPGHPALASDLQEQFRHLMDRAVLEAVTSLSHRHFTRAEYGPFALRIEPWAYRQFMATLLRVMALPCAGLNQSESKSYFRHVQSTTRALKRSLLDPSIPWLPFRHPQRDPLQEPSTPDAPSLNVQSAISNPESLSPTSSPEAAPHEEEGGRGEPPATGDKP
jgi:CRISP-associated protein Cas1